MLDFYLERGYKFRHISDEQLKKNSNKLVEITKIVYGWLKVKKLISYENIVAIYDQEIRKNVKHKRKLEIFERNKLQNIHNIIKILESNCYNGGRI